MRERTQRHTVRNICCSLCATPHSIYFRKGEKEEMKMGNAHKKIKSSKIRQTTSNAINIMLITFCRFLSFIPYHRLLFFSLALFDLLFCQQHSFISLYNRFSFFHFLFVSFLTNATFNLFLSCCSATASS